MKRRISVALISTIALLGAAVPVAGAETPAASSETAAGTTTTAATTTTTAPAPVKGSGGSSEIDSATASKVEVGSSAISAGYGSSTLKLTPEEAKECTELAAKKKEDAPLTEEEKTKYDTVCAKYGLPFGFQVTPETEMAFAIIQTILTVTAGLFTFGNSVLTAFPQLKNQLAEALHRAGIRV
ncbi:hypothetical protein [Corynebacterium caspium]|uniref:hypothetical protein n=1 Tax=Corynebacterium caspium TaxID=234828 RepID=UPI000372070C|nr:hypothetical protein [Corynebacterium caspium]WKD59018.1 hypothetical protein CCASP_03070 [Corynebacterium caspium DSM 44850]